MDPKKIFEERFDKICKSKKDHTKEAKSDAKRVKNIWFKVTGEEKDISNEFWKEWTLINGFKIVVRRGLYIGSEEGARDIFGIAVFALGHKAIDRKNEVIERGVSEGIDAKKVLELGLKISKLDTSKVELESPLLGIKTKE